MKTRVVVGALVLTLLAGGAPASGGTKVVRKDLQAAARSGGTIPVAYFRPATAGSRLLPIVVLPHGGGGRRDCPGDVATAERYAAKGYVSILYTARGHGFYPPGPLSDCAADSRGPDVQSGAYDIFGPKTITDLYDAIAAVVDDEESHADGSRVGLLGYSQGGGTTNLGVAWGDRAEILDTIPGSQAVEPDPYGFDVQAAGPGHTFFDLYRSLAPGECFKLSFGSFVLGVYYTSNGAVVDPWLWTRWAAAFASGSPAARDLVRPDFELRSPKTYSSDLDGVPSLWVQAFDDMLFPADEAIDRFRRAEGDHRLWLSWGGHAAPASNRSDAELAARDREWERWFDHFLRGIDNGVEEGPPVTYWIPDPADPSKQYRATARSWPPPEATNIPLVFGANGSLAREPQGEGEDHLVNTGAVHGLSSDPIVSAVPMGASLPAGARTPAETATFTTGQLASPVVIAGAPKLDLRWSSTGTEFQVNTLLWDVYPDGRRVLVSRGCTQVPNTPGEERKIELELFDTARLVAKGHRLELWVSPTDQPTFLSSHVRSVNTLSYSPKEPSLLWLPLIKGNRR